MENREKESTEIVEGHQDIESGEQTPPPLTLKEKFLGFFKFIGKFLILT